MCASLRPFQNCLQIDSSVNIKAVMMILVHIYALLCPYIRRVPMWQQSGTLQFCSCHGIAGFLVDELEI